MSPPPAPWRRPSALSTPRRSLQALLVCAVALPLSIGPSLASFADTTPVAPSADRSATADAAPRADSGTVNIKPKPPGDAPPEQRQGNNGTVKIDGFGFDTTPGNEPKPGCVFEVDFFGFPVENSPVVTFSSQGNTQPKSTTIPVSTGNTTPQFTGSGPGNGLDHEEQYVLNLTDFTASPDGRFHIKVTVTDADDANFKKSKVFKLLCAPPVVPVAVVDLAIVKSDSVSSIRPGDPLTYTLTVTNEGTESATGFVVTDALPAELTLVSVAGTGFTCTSSGVQCTYNLNLVPDDSASLTVVTTLSRTFTGTVVDNTAVVRPLPAETDIADNTDSELTPVIQPGPPGPPAIEPAGVLPITVTVPPAAEPVRVLPVTVTMPPAVQPVAVSRPAVVNPPTARSSAAATINPASQARPATLPFTGSDTDALLTTAIGVLMLGCAFVAAGRRRKPVSIG